MDRNAIEKASVRLIRVDRALNELRSATKLPEIKAAWGDLLINGNGIHTVLEQGAKSDPRSRQWFGRKNEERKQDSLLRYMHHARNAEEHGIAPILEKTGNTFQLGAGKNGQFRGGGGLYIEHMSIGPGGVTGSWEASEGYEVVAKHTEIAGLIEVFNARYKTSCKPPRDHLGHPLNDFGPLAVGSYWSEYLQTLVEEAKSLS